MFKDWPRGNQGFKSDAIIGGLIFLITLLIFWFSPVEQVTDSAYSMLASQSLLEHHTFVLDQYAIPRSSIKEGDIYQVELVNDHIYYVFPIGSSVLSVPYVAILKKLGISPSNPDGSYNPRGESIIQTSLAAILMAALAAIFFYTSRLLLPPGWSIVVAFGGALGTQVWSTASRGLWSHTWEILLLGIVVYLVLAAETGGRRMNPVVMASLLAWSYFARPSSSVFIVALSLYIFLYHREIFFRYALTGAAWFAGFIAYSWHNFRRVLPLYYLMRSLYRDYWSSFANNLVGPSRGLLIYVPVLLFVAYLLVRYWKYVELPRLVWLALAVVLVHLIVAAWYWAGHSYGPRYTTDLVPWFVLLAVLGLQAMLRWRAIHRAQLTVLNWNVTLVIGAVLLAMSVFANARGAVSLDTWRWNVLPVSVDKAHGRLWDWSDPQFLAGLLPPPPPHNFPLVKGKTKIDFTDPEADKYLWYGWSGPERQFRWTDGHEAAIIFALAEIKDLALEIKLGPFLAPGKLDEQQLEISLNGRAVKRLALKESAAAVYILVLPKEALGEKNILRLRMPDAASPRSMGVSEDGRRLGVRVEWIDLKQQGAQQ